MHKFNMNAAAYILLVGGSLLFSWVFANLAKSWLDQDGNMQRNDRVYWTTFALAFVFSLCCMPFLYKMCQNMAK